MKDGMGREFSEHPGDLFFRYDTLDNENKRTPLYIRVEGFCASPEDPYGPQIMIEVYEQRLYVRVWNGDGIDPETLTIDMKQTFSEALYADKSQLPLLINDEDTDVQALVKRRLGKD